MNPQELEHAAEVAFAQGAVERTTCKGKQEVLDLIIDDKADTMSVDNTSLRGIGERPMMIHFAVRFNDRELGAQIREHAIRGFGI